MLLHPFVSTGKDGAPATQDFCDRGFMGLPLDNQMDDLLMPTWFTEMWVPFTPGDGRVQETIARLRRLFDADGTAEGAYAATGAFAFELYAARRDDTFFLSPATGSHVFRVDVFWFAHNQGNPVTDFFPQFWDALEPLGYRLHWGKFLPSPDAARPDRLTSRYPQWERWKAVRERVSADPATGVWPVGQDVAVAAGHLARERRKDVEGVLDRVGETAAKVQVMDALDDVVNGTEFRWQPGLSGNRKINSTVGVLTIHHAERPE